MTNKTLLVKIMETWAAKSIIFVTVVSWYLLAIFIIENVFPPERGDIYWGITLMCHFHYFCCIALGYSIFFPSKKILIAALLLQTAVNIIFFTSAYPYRYLEMSVRAYACLIVPMAISWYIKKLSNAESSESKDNRCNMPDDKK
jgi:hypothetical protein